MASFLALLLLPYGPLTLPLAVVYVLSSFLIFYPCFKVTPFRSSLSLLEYFVFGRRATVILVFCKLSLILSSI